MAKQRPRGKKDSGSKPPPVCKAILLCDQVIRDAMTGKASLIGIFDAFRLETVPGHTRPVTAFLQLIEGIGSYILTVEVHDLQADTVIARATTVSVEFANRLQKRQVIIGVPPLPVAHAGIYDFVVLADGKEVDRQQFVVVVPQETSDEAEEPKEPGEPE